MESGWKARGLGTLALLLGLLGGCGGATGVRSDRAPELTRIESEPEGASVFVQGGFVGVTPASFHMPARDRVELRLEFPGFVPQEDVLLRDTGVPDDAPEGVGWDPLYYYQLTRK